MATLFNTKISATYPGLIKTLDNTALTATLKQLTDGSGNTSGLYANTAGDFKVTSILEWGSLKDTGTGVTITQWVTSADGIGNFNNDTTVPTSAAVKTYVDAVVTASDLDFLGDTNTGTPAVDLDSQNFSVLGTTNEIVTSGANQTLTIGLPNSVTISGTYTGATFSGDLNGTINTATTATTQSAGDNSTKVATTAYVDSLDAASDLDFSGDSGTGDVTLNTQVLAITGTTNQIVTTAANQGLSLSLPATVHRDLQGNVTGNVDGDLTGNVTATSVLADGVSATTQASSDSSTKVATTAFVKGLNNASDLDFTTDSGSGAVVLNTETFSVLGTTNQINSAGSGQAVTLSLPATVHRNLLGNVTGDLTGNADTATKWETARNLSVSGEAVGTISNVDGTLNVSGAVTLDNNSVTGKVLTGLATPSASSIVPADSILEAFGKMQSQINSQANGLRFQGSWNVATNDPALISGGGESASGTTTGVSTGKLIDSNANFSGSNPAVTIGNRVVNQVDGTIALVTNIDSATELSIDTDIMLSGEAYTIDIPDSNGNFLTQGHYYVVSVGGARTLNGITNWSVGDWAIVGSNNEWTILDHTDVEGVGTIGNIPKWTGTGTIADSIMAESGSEITVTGILSTTTNLNSGSNFAVATDKFTANATTGNVAFPGDLAINTNKFTVAATSGNTVVAGTLDVTSTASIGSHLTINGVSAGTSTYQQWKNDGTLFAYNGSAAAIISGGSATDYVAGNTTGSTSVILSTNNTARLTINGLGNSTFAGNVTVGTNITTTAGRLQLGAVALPSAGVAAITNRSSDNSLYIQTSSGNTTYLLDGSQNTMYSAGSTAHSFYISNVPKLTINSSGNSTFAGDVSITQNSGSLEFSNTGSGHGSITTGLSKDLNIGAASGNVYINNNTTFAGSVTAAGSIKTCVNVEGAQVGLLDNTCSTLRTFWAYDDTAKQSYFWNNEATAFTSFYTNSLERLRIDSSGNVTIKNPTTSNLQLQSDQQTWDENDVISNLNTFISDTSATGARDVAAIKIINEQAGTNTTTSGAMAFYTSAYNATATEKLRIDSSGNVGIGLDPVYKLDVRGDRIRVNPNSDDFVTAEIQNTTGSFYFAIDNTTGSAFGGANSARTIFSSGNYPMSFYTNSIERMRITSGGDVLINRTARANGYDSGFKTLSVASNLDEKASILELIGTRSEGGNQNGMIHFYTDRVTLTQTAGITGLTGTGTNGYLAGELSFSTKTTTGSLTERMRLTSVGFTKAKANGGNYFNGSYHEFLNNNNVSGDRVMVIGNTVGDATNNTSSIAFTVADNSNDRLFIYGNGNVVNFNNSYGSMSDVKLKENIVNATPKLDDLMKVKIRNYNFIGDDKKQIGVVAQELEGIFPNMIDEIIDYEYKKITDKEGNITEENIDLGTTTKSVKYSVFVPMLIKAIQELKAEVDKLKQECNCK